LGNDLTKPLRQEHAFGHISKCQAPLPTHPNFEMRPNLPAGNGILNLTTLH
jgi:hypothetical protein